VEKLIASNRLMRKPEEAAYFEQRYQAAFPRDFLLWKQAQDSGASDKAP
jgi:hypothetical protein